MPERRGQVVTAWRATYDPALSVQAGERVTLGRRDDEFPGWQWVVNADGLGGWLPDSFLDQDRVAADFNTQELTVTTGDNLVLGAMQDGWIWCRNPDTGAEGWVPETCFDTV